MTMLKFAATFTRRRGQILSQLKPSTTTWWKRSDERNSLENLSRLSRRMVGRMGVEEGAPLMQAAGHRLLTPTYTGLGERAHLAHPGIDLDAHIEDMLNVIKYEDLRDIVLIGHSYGGADGVVAEDRCVVP